MVVRTAVGIDGDGNGLLNTADARNGRRRRRSRAGRGEQRGQIDDTNAIVARVRNDRYPNHVVNAHPSGIRARGHVRNLLNHSALRQVQDGGGVGAVVRDHGKAEFLADREALGRRSHGNGTAKQLAKRRTGGVQVEFHNAVATGDAYQTEGRKWPVGNLISDGYRTWLGVDWVAA